MVEGFTEIRIKDIYNDGDTVHGRLLYIIGCEVGNPKLKSKGVKFLCRGLIGQNPIPEDLKKVIQEDKEELSQMDKFYAKLEKRLEMRRRGKERD